MLSISSVQPDFFPKADNLFQSHLWGSFKEILGQKALYFRVVFNDDDGNEVAYPLLVLLRKIKDQFVYAYVQRTPNESVIPSDKTCFLEELSLALKDSDSPLASLYIFKTGFGGNITHFAGAWDFPFKQEEYESFRISESLLLK